MYISIEVLLYVISLVFSLLSFAIVRAIRNYDSLEERVTSAEKDIIEVQTKCNIIHNGEDEKWHSIGQS